MSSKKFVASEIDGVSPGCVFSFSASFLFLYPEIEMKILGLLQQSSGSFPFQRDRGLDFEDCRSGVPPYSRWSHPSPSLHLFFFFITFFDIHLTTYSSSFQRRQSRGYVAKARKRDWKKCFPCASDDDYNDLMEKSHELPPLNVSKFRIGTIRFKSKQSHAANNGLDIALTLLEPIKEQFFLFFPMLTSTWYLKPFTIGPENLFHHGREGDLYGHESLLKVIKEVDVVISTMGHALLADQTKIIAAIKEVGANIKKQQLLPM
ncbi:hypothetical protein Nepgr_017088 [Nepenthes gracilis]|uniref:NmrA-like domain-containing protein n=1 Tax=Nepenthes gracilis TaxID=150966 RepID=A0AAD3SQI5_NEPGR|nr:hypothetical protein Nepgr_017088 [Nepenthes gracilis]